MWFPFKRNQLYIESKSLYDSEPVTIARSELIDLLANNATLRIWLPEPLRLVMDQVAKHLDTTLSKYLREYFVVYLYGNHALIDMYKNQTGIFYQPPKENASVDDYDPPRYSRVRSVEFIPSLGKNIVPMKIFLNEQLKSDLQSLADKSKMALSQFVREILVSHFLGHTVWPERQQMLKVDSNDIAGKWESGHYEAHSIREPSAKEEAQLEGKIEYLHL
ncbi:MAG TPA: hypothetical protein VIO39_07455 [Methylotenera sp.]